jgi:hypothetical protein
VNFRLEPSAAEFAADLRAAAKALEGNMQDASEIAARKSAVAMRARYNARYPRRSGRAAGSFRSTGGQEPTVAFGSSSIPYMLGQNFGSGRYRQFPRRTSPDHFAFSAVRAETKSIASVYGKAADDAMSEAF